MWIATSSAIVSYAHKTPFVLIRFGSNPNSLLDIQAETTPSATDEQLRVMYRSLLSKKLGFKFHYSTQDATVYAVTISKRGLKIKPHVPGVAPLLEDLHGPRSAQPSPVNVVIGGSASGLQILARDATISQICEALTEVVQTTVNDDTGLHSRYDINLRFRSPQQEVSTVDPDPSEFPTLSEALDDLGLTIKPEKGKVTLLVVDHIDKTPEIK